MTSGLSPLDDLATKGRHYNWTFIASLGDFLDAGMFAGTGITLLAIATLLHFNTLESGLPALVTLLGTAFGALVFGVFGDKFGRKYIYQIDMIIYAVAAILLSITGIFPGTTFNLIWAMVFYALIGIAVGADVPTSWSLISEFSPKKSRGKLMSITNIMWYVGVLVELGIAIALYNTGMTLFRTIWLMLGIIAIITWFLRRKLVESPRFMAIKGDVNSIKKTLELLGAKTNINEKVSYKKHTYKEIFTTFLPVTLWAWFLYLMWGIPASTYGEFFPYIFSSLHIVSTQSVFAFEAVYFGSAIVPGLLIYAFLTDRINVGRAPLWLVSTAMSALSFYLLVYPPFLKSVPVLLTSFLLFGIGQGIGVWPIVRLISIEHYPTSIRNSGQGFIWFTMRLEAAVFGLFTPTIVGANGIHVEYIGWIAGTFFLAAFIAVAIAVRVSPKLIKTESISIDEISNDSAVVAP
ncbi:MAG: MFS transporter [Thermoplasmatales archaeon]